MGCGRGMWREVQAGRCCMAHPGICMVMPHAPGMAQAGWAAAHIGIWVGEHTGTGWGPAHTGMPYGVIVTGAEAVTCLCTCSMSMTCWWPVAARTAAAGCSCLLYEGGWKARRSGDSVVLRWEFWRSLVLRRVPGLLLARAELGAAPDTGLLWEVLRLRSRTFSTSTKGRSGGGLGDVANSSRLADVLRLLRLGLSLFRPESSVMIPGTI